MNWNEHKALEGTHAFLGASQFRWINWDDETLTKRFMSHFSTDIGTIIHALASECIKRKIRLSEYDINLIEMELAKNNIPRTAYDPKAILLNLIPFVNDSIDWLMDSEILLFYSYYAYGTADAIGYDEKEKVLRINDYKSGSIEAHIEQLKLYAAYFCLEYHKDPAKMKRIELRIYQNYQVIECVLTPETQDISKFMTIVQEQSRKTEILFRRG